jgi:16S rRNA processing protein RimM
MEWLEAGKIVGVHGIRGEVTMEIWCDSPAFLKSVKRFGVQTSGAFREVPIESTREHQGRLLVKFSDISSREDAQALRGTVLYFHRSDVSLPEGKHFLADLIGLEAKGVDGTSLGRLTAVWQQPTHDVYVIQDGETEHLVPAVKPFLQQLDPTNGILVLELIEGM